MVAATTAGLVMLAVGGCTDDPATPEKTGGRPAASGAYFVRMMVGGRMRSQRLVLVH